MHPQLSTWLHLATANLAATLAWLALAKADLPSKTRGLWNIPKSRAIQRGFLYLQLKFIKAWPVLRPKGARG
jgi:hypothetical protein